MKWYQILDAIHEIITLGSGCVVTDASGREVEFVRHRISLSGSGLSQEIVGETPSGERRWVSIRQIKSVRET
ncbi:MAG: hypothetical protein UV82_C0008G0042 [Candidatus Magasanikbacteria bacterium GW2011_GWD2_43_18]|nr:MAG: hypothetical protein UV18_C0002G0025 [Candidatus Magasanikbacteria bacterium GW2011_GWC2_42_27]KKT04438.1 MAG: hypothetical protein UV82_C0008G0042 [Candidatus Magasanikbacteria bacterium GW2011_GWD2_43_18]KKT26051.1 MAG: hypothetical protein UW10_C0002G0051 [Candidatus Magasanikbacteria bacterium GW2011_GWA2_43_9]